MNDKLKTVLKINVEQYLLWHSQMYSDYKDLKETTNETIGAFENLMLQYANPQKDNNGIDTLRKNLYQKLRLHGLEESKVLILKAANNISKKKEFEAIFIIESDLKFLQMTYETNLYIFEHTISALLIGVLPEKEVLERESKKVWKEGRKNILRTFNFMLLPIPILKVSYEIFINGMTDICYLQFLNEKIESREKVENGSDNDRKNGLNVPQKILMAKKLGILQAVELSKYTGREQFKFLSLLFGENHDNLRKASDKLHNRTYDKSKNKNEKIIDRMLGME